MMGKTVYMTSDDYYIQKFIEELQCCKDGGFTGNVQFQVNFKQGNVSHMNITVAQSFKKPNEK